MAGDSKKYEERITRDPGVCGGEPVFKGTCVTFRTVLASLAAGDSTEDILADFPSLKPEDVRAAIAFAAASAEVDLPVPAIPHVQTRYDITFCRTRRRDQPCRERFNFWGPNQAILFTDAESPCWDQGTQLLLPQMEI